MTLNTSSFYGTKTMNFNKEEIELTMVMNVKRQHRFPVIPQPKSDNYIGRLTYEQDFNNQGKHGWGELGTDNMSYAKQPFNIGDTIKLEGTNNYVQITDIIVKRIQDFTEEDIEREGKNYFKGVSQLRAAHLAVLVERYEIEWNDYIGQDNIPTYGYHLNTWVWEVHFKPVRDKENERVDKLNRRKVL